MAIRSQFIRLEGRSNRHTGPNRTRSLSSGRAAAIQSVFICAKCGIGEKRRIADETRLRQGQVLIILLFGPPGSGKGTQGRLMLEWMPEKIPSISTGDMLRAEISAQSPLGVKTQQIIAAGGLVGDDLMNEVVRSRLSQPDCKSGFMLDGYPRTLEQAEFLDTLLAELKMASPIVIHLDVPADVLVGRMVSRRQCSKCGQMYNVLSQRPKVPGICDNDGESLFMRKDDQEDVIRERLRTYEDVTRPVLNHYPSSQYFQISGDRSTTYIFEEITQILDGVLKSRRTAVA